MNELPKAPASELTDEEKATYEWQIWTRDFGEEGQRRLKNSTVLISRCGGLGSVVAYELAAAGIGRLVIAHGGNVKHSDLNRQLLMTHDWAWQAANRNDRAAVKGPQSASRNRTDRRES